MDCLVEVLRISVVHRMPVKELSLDYYTETEAYSVSKIKGLARSYFSHPLPCTLSQC